MKILKDIIKSSVISVMISVCIFVIIGMIFDRIGNGTFMLSDYKFSKMVLACVVTGLGYGAPTFLYSMDKMPKILASVIHLGIGLTLYFIAAITVGWIPTNVGLVASIATAAGMVVITLIIWVCFMKYYKDLADKMNKELQRRN